MNRIIITYLNRLILLWIVLFVTLAFPSISHSAKVIILGDTKLKPVSDVINGIEKNLHFELIIKTPKEVKTDLENIVNKEDASLVIALGKEALSIAQILPDYIPVIYGLIIKPLETKRANITGVYMTTPINEYVLFIHKHFPKIKKIGIVCTQNAQKTLLPLAKMPEVKLCIAETPFEFIEGLNSFGDEVDAILLLPERKLITSKVLEKLYLFSFQNKKPVIGISEKYVKIGSLFSLGFETTAMGMQIGELANRVIINGSTTGIQESSPDELNLYINKNTSESMSVDIPDELLEAAKKVYQ